MRKYATGEDRELWRCVSDALMRYVKMLTQTTEVSEESFCLLQKTFFKQREEIADEERRVVLGERHIAGAILYGGSEGLLRLAKECMLFPEEKAENAAEALVKEVARIQGLHLGADERAILVGILKKVILDKEAEFQSRIGEEVGIAY